MTKRGRKPITEQQRETDLLADPISQVLLGDPEYARWFATERRRFNDMGNVDSGAGRREPGEDFSYAVESEDEWI